MSNLFRVIFNLSCLFFVLMVNAQVNTPPELPKVIGPTPEAASLAKFGEIPVDYANGMYNLSVPIHSINTPYLSVPVSLNYHSLGVIVGETASSVGLNWALSAGGSITRQIRGNPDDISGGYLHHTYTNYFSDSKKRTNVYNNEIPYNDNKIPDKFSINLPGISGSFIYDHESKEPRLKSLENVQIETIFDGSKIIGFKLKNLNGVEFVLGPGNYRTGFKTINVTNNNPAEFPVDNLNNVYNSWVVDQINLPKGDTIYFGYDDGDYLLEDITKDEMVDGDHITSINQSRVYEKYVSSISYNNTKVDFIYNTDRLDIHNQGNNAKRLSLIKVYDVSDSQQSVLIKVFELESSYFGATQQSQQNRNPYFNPGSSINLDDYYSSKKLRLDRVVQKSPKIKYNTSEKEELVYSFTYNSNKVADKFSTAQDYWGYYNGADNGNHLLFGGATNRRVDDAFGKLGLIQGITYPNGLVKKFEYERQGGYFSPKLSNAGTELINPTISKSVNLGSLSNLNSVIMSLDFEVGNEAVDFEFSASKCNNQANTNFQDVNFAFTITNESNVVLMSVPANNSNCIINFSPINLHGMTSQPTFVPGTYTLEVTTTGHSGEYQPLGVYNSAGIYEPPKHIGFNFLMRWKESTVEDENYLMGPGYRIKEISSWEQGYEDNLSVQQFSYTLENGTSCGVINGLPNYYVKNSSFGGQMGFNAIEGNYTNSVFNNYQGNQNSYSRVVIRQGAKEKSDPNSTEYSYYLNGERELQFSVSDDGNRFLSYPFILPDSNSWLNGKLLLEKYYAYDENNNKKIVSEKYNDYTHFSPFSSSVNTWDEPLTTLAPIQFEYLQGSGHQFFGSEQSGNLFADNYQGNINEDGLTYPTNPSSSSSGNIWRVPLAANYLENTVNNGYVLKYKVYYITGGFLKLNSVSTKNYFYDDEGLSGTIEKNTYYDYYNEDFVFNKKSVLSEDYNNGSLVNTTKQQFYYPSDSITLPSWYPSNWDTQPLINAHRIGNPVAVETYRNDELTSKLGYKYEITPLNLFEIKEAHFAKGNQALEPKVIYDKYDNRGNVLQVRKADGTPIIYIYGYHQTKPIAKLVNASYENLSSAQQAAIDAVKTASNADNDYCQGASPTDCNEAALRYELNNLQDQFPKAQVSTYTYDPLVGVTSETDPSGRVMYYEYDHFNRLARIVDENGNILEEYEYNYRGNN